MTKENQLLPQLNPSANLITPLLPQPSCLAQDTPFLASFESSLDASSECALNHYTTLGVLQTDVTYRTARNYRNLLYRTSVRSSASRGERSRMLMPSHRHLSKLVKQAVSFSTLKTPSRSCTAGPLPFKKRPRSPDVVLLSQSGQTLFRGSRFRDFSQFPAAALATTSAHSSSRRTGARARAAGDQPGKFPDLGSPNQNRSHRILRSIDHSSAAMV